MENNAFNIPITRGNLFFSEDEFRMQMGIANEYIKNVLNFKVILFRIDYTNTSTSIYGSVKDENKIFMDPVEINVYNLKIEDYPQESLGEGRIAYEQYGNLTFNVMLSELEFRGIEIKRGDLVGYALDENRFKYFEVSDDDRLNYDNANTIIGYKPISKRIVCTHTDFNEEYGFAEEN